MNVFVIALAIVIGYIVGSIPWGLIIGKVFYQTDIRQHGSGNLGGTNAGRVLGKKAGISVIVLDALKALIVMIIFKFINPDSVPYAGWAVMIGHCFPIFANFKGGKGVATGFGYLLGLSLICNCDFIFTFIIPILVFFICLCFTKMVSLSSMLALSIVSIISIITMQNKIIAILIVVMTIFIIYRHKANIIRIINKKENKITWIK